MTKEEYFGGWLKVIDSEIMNSVTSRLEGVYRKVPVCPAKGNVFRAFHICPYDELKIVFIGQDPYPQKDVATGVLFGNSPDTPEEKLSPSLQIVKEAVINPEKPHGPIMFDNSMESWAKQGILMINSALTVEMNKIGSHVILWRPFVSKLLTNLSEYNPGLIYVLFGSQAQTFRPYINKNNTIFEVKHPAYYARTGQKFVTDLFDRINVLLKERNNTQIKWYEEIL